MSENKKKFSLGLALLVAIIGVLAVVISTSGGPVNVEGDLLGTAEDEVVTDEIGPPPSLMLDPDLVLNGALTLDGNFFKFERNSRLPDIDDLDGFADKETWTTLVTDEEYDSILDFLNENTDVVDQLSLSVIWDAEEQDWEVYPNKIFRSKWDIETLDIFKEDFDGTLIFNASAPFEYSDHVEKRVGDFEIHNGWNLGPKPDFSEIRGRRVVFWTGDVDGTADRLTPRADLDKIVDKDFYEDLDDDEIYWFYIHRTTVSCSCSDTEAPVCGVDGNTYMNSCKAACSDVDVDYSGSCKVDRNALFPRLKEVNLLPDGTLVLEFFKTTSDTSPEEIDIDNDEIEIDENARDLVVYNIDGNPVKVVALDNSDVDVNSRSIKIDLGGDLAVGKYELRVFNTFERENVVKSELGFNVVDPQPEAGPALILNSNDVEAEPSDEINLETGIAGMDVALASGKSMADVVVVSKCTKVLEGKPTSCATKVDVTADVNIEFASDDEGIVISKTGGLDAGKYEIEVKEGFVYENGKTVEPGIYEFLVKVIPVTSDACFNPLGDVAWLNSSDAVSAELADAKAQLIATHSNIDLFATVDFSQCFDEVMLNPLGNALNDLEKMEVGKIYEVANTDVRAFDNADSAPATETYARAFLVLDSNQDLGVFFTFKADGSSPVRGYDIPTLYFNDGLFWALDGETDLNGRDYTRS